MLKFVIIFLFFSVNVWANNPLQLRSISSFVDGVAKNEDYIRQKLDLFSRYSLSRRNLIGANFGMTKVEFPSNSQYSSGFTFSGVEVFHRYRFYDGKNNYLTLQNLINTPDLARNTVNANSSKWEYEVRLLFGHNFKEGLTASIVNASTPYFMRAELGYRKRFDSSFDQIRYQFLGAVRILPKSYIFLQHNINWNVQTSGSNQLNNTFSNFDIAKTTIHTVQISLTHKVSKNNALQVGYYKKIGGNTQIYDSQGFVIGIWSLIDIHN